jgi:hypothetical protein
MALAYLVGSKGHFGQANRKDVASNVYWNPDESVLLLSNMEINLLVELLANTMHKRAKDGPGGYSAATFSLKYVLFAIRCLLTHTSNQVQMANVAGVRLNSLLIKALAHHSILKTNTMDAEAATYASFSLYLQSSYGFQVS